MSARNLQGSGRDLALWSAVNIAGTLLIVSVNRRIPRSEYFRHCQIILAGFDFGCTGLISKAGSRIGASNETNISLTNRSFLAVLACFSVILDNYSLANLPPFTHQMIRILVTPTTALLGRLTKESSIDRSSALRLAIACGGVAISIQSERPPSRIIVPTTSALTVALTAVLIRSLYSVQVSRVQKEERVTSSRLLELQMPVAYLFSVLCSPLIDVLPEFRSISVPSATAILLSALCACMINVSHFAIIKQAGSVGTLGSSSIIHVKTVALIAMSCYAQGQITPGNIFGLLITSLAVYSYFSIS